MTAFGASLEEEAKQFSDKKGNTPKDWKAREETESAAAGVVVEIRRKGKKFQRPT